MPSTVYIIFTTVLLFVADEDLKLSLIFEERPGSRRGQRSSRPAANIETLIVADKTMLDFHGEAHVKDYILTIMNMVGNKAYL